MASFHRIYFRGEVQYMYVHVQFVHDVATRKQIGLRDGFEEFLVLRAHLLAEKGYECDPAIRLSRIEEILR